MPSPFSLGAQNAEALFDAFVQGALYAGVTASATGDVAITIATIGFVPDFAITSGNLEGGGEVGWTTTTTTFTIKKSATTAIKASYILGNLT